MKAILFDMDGVLYEGNTAIPGARETIAWCHGQGIPHLFLTNTTSRPRSALVEKLQSLGITADVDDILNPPRAAVNWLQHNISVPVALFVQPASYEEFAALSIADEKSETVGAVVLGDLGAGWDFATYNRAFQLLMHNPQAPLIALGMTRFWQADDGLRLDVGPYVKGLEYACNREAVVLGKPAAPFFHSALQQLGITATETIMIGDDIRGDIDGAQQAGINGVLVRSGKFRETDLALGIEPYTVINSIADLPAWWAKQ